MPLSSNSQATKYCRYKVRGADQNEPKLSKTKTIKYKKSTTTDKSNVHTEENLSIEDGAYYTKELSWG